MGESKAWKQVSSSLILLQYFCVLFTPIHKAKQNIQTFRCTIPLWKSQVCKHSIRFQVIKLKLFCETLKHEKWKILAWCPNKMWQYCQRNPKCSNWCWTKFQMQVALFWKYKGFLPIIPPRCSLERGTYKIIFYLRGALIREGC